MSGTDDGTADVVGGRSTSGLVRGRPGLRLWAVKAYTLEEVQGVSGLAIPDFPKFWHSLESCDWPIIKKLEANAALDFWTGILKAELLQLPCCRASFNGEGRFSVFIFWVRYVYRRNLASWYPNLWIINLSAGFYGSPSKAYSSIPTS